MQNNNKISIHMPEHLKKQVELAANYYGITQSEFIKDAIKEKLMQHDKNKSIVGMFFNEVVK
jgi:metal-responsive CopG/Arc/MetJ family transcriptional regulator